MSKQEFSIPSLAMASATEADAYMMLEDLRWGGEPVVPALRRDRPHYFLNPANGTSRKTRTGTHSQRRVWKCRDCRKQFSRADRDDLPRHQDPASGPGSSSSSRCAPPRTVSRPARLSASTT